VRETFIVETSWALAEEQSVESNALLLKALCFVKDFVRETWN